MASQVGMNTSVRILYMSYRPKGAPKWESLTADEQAWWEDTDRAARSKVQEAIDRRVPLARRSEQRR